MDLFIELLIRGLFGTVGAVVANSRGRSPIAWFLLGFFFPCISLGILMVLPDLKLEEQKHRRLVTENRRLKEQMRKDRIVADSRFMESQRRLEVHDKALGVETARPEPQLLSSSNPAASGANPAQPNPQAVGPENMAAAQQIRQKQWYFANAEGRQGPVAFTVLKALWDQRQIHSNTYVWCDGMKDWLTVETVVGMRGALDGRV